MTQSASVFVSHECWTGIDCQLWGVLEVKLKDILSMCEKARICFDHDSAFLPLYIALSLVFLYTFILLHRQSVFTARHAACSAVLVMSEMSIH